MRYHHYKNAIEFRDLMGQPIGSDDPEQEELQIDLIIEEHVELMEAFSQTPGSRTECLKELADLVYVCFQLAALKGWDLDEALHRVHESNLSKLVDGKPQYREDGKVLKGPNYKPPVLGDLV